MKHPRIRMQVGAVCLLTVVAACTTLPRNPDVAGSFSDKLSPYNYKEEGSIARLVVGVEAARFIRSEPYVPLFAQVVNRSKMTFHITRESFTLEDSLGRQYAMAPMREVAENYQRLDLDRRLFRQNTQFTAAGISVFTLISSNFYPSSSRTSLVVDHVTLPPASFMEDVLYFPIPESGLNGTPLRLLFKVQGIEEPIQVVFQVPKTLGIMEKEGDRDSTRSAPPVPEVQPQQP
jgi:hypothetical protein